MAASMELNYLQRIAEDIQRHVSKDEMPDENTRGLFRIYAVLLLAKGEAVTTTDVHNAWVAWMCSIDPEHESIVPSEDLADAVVESDQPYVDAIVAVSRARITRAD
jgi:hypothetical protein